MHFIVKIALIIEHLMRRLIIINIQKTKNSMSAGWDSHDGNHQGINFDEVFADPTLNAMKLITIQNIVEQCKTQDEKVTDKLISKSAILQDILDICLRPQLVKNAEFGQITTEHTYKAHQIISSLEIERFSEYLLGMKKKQESQEDTVITQEIMQKEGEIEGESIPLFRKVLSNLQEKKPLEETPLGYMCKIGTNVCSQKPKQVLRLYQENRYNVLDLIFQHFYSNSILQFLIRVLEMEDSTSFYETEKVNIFEHFVHALSKVDGESVMRIRLEILENYANLINFLYEKTDDRYEKPKFISLCKRIFPCKFPIQHFLTRSKYLISRPLDEASIQQLPYIILILEKYLHFHNNYKPSLLNNINTSISQHSNNRSQGNIGSGIENKSSQGGLDASVVMDIVLDPEIIAGIREISIDIANTISNNIFNNQKEGTYIRIPLNFLISYFKLVKSLLLTFQPFDRKFIESLISPDLIRLILYLTKIHKSSTILHNIFKDIIIQCLFKNYEYLVEVFFDPKKSNFLELANQMRGTVNSGQNEFQNQIYHILQAILKRGEDQSNANCLEDVKKNCMAFSQLLIKAKDKEKLYLTLIGGDPRKQSSCWGQDQQDDRIFTTNQRGLTNSGNKIAQEALSPQANDVIEGSTQHWFDCGGLPLDSDQSKDEQDIPQNKSQQRIEEPVGVKILGELQFKQCKLRQVSPAAQSQLSKRLKNIGIKQCEEEQIRIPVRKQRYSGSGKSRKKSKGTIEMGTVEKTNETFKNDDKEPIVDKKEAIDKVQEELEDQIRKLQNKRLHHVENIGGEDEQIQERLKKKVDSLQQQIPGVAVIQTQQHEIIMSGVMDISSDKEKGLQQQQQMLENRESSEKKQNSVVERPEEVEKKVVSCENKEEKGSKREQNSREEGKRDGQNSSLPTYLSFQIDQILARLD